MTRLALLRHLTETEDGIQEIYDRAASELKKLSVDHKNRAEAKAIMEWADQEAQEIIYNAIRHGADLGEEEAIRQTLEVFKRRWKP